MLSRETDADSYSHARLDYHATVRELPSDERPRERLQHFGAGALSQAELLAIILRTGTRGDNALELANKLLSKYGGLPGLVRADFQELCAEHGMGEAKSAQVKATLEKVDIVLGVERLAIAPPNGTDRPPGGDVGRNVHSVDAAGVVLRGDILVVN